MRRPEPTTDAGERAIVQLAGCLMAAEGNAELDGDGDATYGWSPAYQAIVELRRRAEMLNVRSADAEVEQFNRGYDLAKEGKSYPDEDWWAENVAEPIDDPVAAQRYIWSESICQGWLWFHADALVAARAARHQHLTKAEETIEFLLGMVKDYAPSGDYDGIAAQPAQVLAHLRAGK